MKNFINSYDRVKNAIESGKAINIFNLVDGDFFGLGSFEYSNEATIILELVAKNGEGFVVDICNRVLESIKDGRKDIILSDEQRWCVAYVALKMNTSLVDDIRKADEAFIAEVEGEEASDSDDAENEASKEETTTFAVIAFYGNGDSNTIFESEDKSSAEARYAQEVKVAGEPVDIAGWTDSDQAWSSMYHIELLKTTRDEDGDIVYEEGLEHSEFFNI